MKEDEVEAGEEEQKQLIGLENDEVEEETLKRDPLSER